MHKISRYPISSETQKGSPTEIFGNVTQNVWKNIVIHPHFSYQKNFAKPESFWNTEVFPHEFFRYTETKKRKQEIVKTDFFWNREGFPYENFRFCETKTLTKNRDTQPSSLIQKKIRYTNFSETQTCSATKLSDSAGQKLNKTKKWYPTLMKKTVSTENRDTRPLFYP